MTSRDNVREALEAAGRDLIGFEGYFERLGSMGTVQSIRTTLDKIDAALKAFRGGEEPGEKWRFERTLSLDSCWYRIRSDTRTIAHTQSLDDAERIVADHNAPMHRKVQTS